MVNALSSCQLAALSFLVIAVGVSCYPLYNNMWPSIIQDMTLQSQESLGSPNSRGINVKKSQLQEGSEALHELETSDCKLVSSDEAEDELYDSDNIHDRLVALGGNRNKRDTSSENQDGRVNYLEGISDRFDTAAASDGRIEQFNKEYGRDGNIDARLDSGDRGQTEDDTLNNLQQSAEKDDNLAERNEANEVELPSNIDYKSDELEENVQNLDDSIDKLQESDDISDDQLQAFHDIAAKIQNLAIIDEQADREDKQDGETNDKSSDYMGEDDAEIEDLDDIAADEDSSDIRGDEMEALDESDGNVENQDESGESLREGERYANDEGADTLRYDAQADLVEAGNPSSEAEQHVKSKREINRKSFGKQKVSKSWDATDGGTDTKYDSNSIDGNQEINEFDDEVDDLEEDDNVDMADDDSNSLENTNQFLEGKRKLTEESPKHIRPEAIENQGMRNNAGEYEDEDRDGNNLDSEDSDESALDSDVAVLDYKDSINRPNSFSDEVKHVVSSNEETVDKREACESKNKTCGTLHAEKPNAKKSTVANAGKNSVVGEEDSEYRYEENEAGGDSTNFAENQEDNGNSITSNAEDGSLNTASNADVSVKTASDTISDNIDKSIIANSNANVIEKEFENEDEIDSGKTGKCKVNTEKKSEHNSNSDVNKEEKDNSILDSDSLTNSNKRKISKSDKNKHNHLANVAVPDALARGANKGESGFKLKNENSLKSKTGENVDIMDVLNADDKITGSIFDESKNTNKNDYNTKKAATAFKTKSVLNDEIQNELDELTYSKANDLVQHKTELDRHLDEKKPILNEDVFKNLYIQQLCDEIKHRLELSYMADIPAEQITDIVKRELEHDLKNLRSYGDKRRHAVVHRAVDAQHAPSQNVGEFLKGQVLHNLPATMEHSTRDVIGEYIEKVFNDYFKNAGSEEGMSKRVGNPAEESNFRRSDSLPKDSKLSIGPSRVVINGVPEYEYFQLYPSKKESLAHSRDLNSNLRKDPSLNNPYLGGSLDKLIHSVKDGNVHGSPEYTHLSNLREPKPFARSDNLDGNQLADKGLNGEYIKIEVFNLGSDKNQLAKSDDISRRRAVNEKGSRSLKEAIENECKKKLETIYVKPELFDAVGRMHARPTRRLLSHETDGNQADRESTRNNRRTKRNSPGKNTFWGKAKREVQILTRIKDPERDNKPYRTNIVKRRLNKELGDILNSDTRLVESRNGRERKSLKSDEMNDALNIVLISFAEKYLKNDNAEGSNDNNDSNANEENQEDTRSDYEEDSSLADGENEYDYDNRQRRRLLSAISRRADVSQREGRRASKHADSLVDWEQALKRHASIRKRDLSTDPLNGYGSLASQDEAELNEEKGNIVAEEEGSKNIIRNRDSMEILLPPFGEAKEEKVGEVIKSAEIDPSGDSRNVGEEKKTEESPSALNEENVQRIDGSSKNSQKRDTNLEGTAMNSDIPTEVKTLDEVLPLVLSNPIGQSSEDNVPRRSRLERSDKLESEPLMSRLERMDLSQSSLDRFDDIKERTGRTDIGGIAVNQDDTAQKRVARETDQSVKAGDETEEEPLNQFEEGLFKILEKLDNLDEGGAKQECDSPSEKSLGDSELSKDIQGSKQICVDESNEINPDGIKTEDSDESRKNHIRKRDLAEDLLYSFGGPSENNEGRRSSNVKKMLNAEYLDYTNDVDSKPAERSLDDDSVQYVPPDQISEVDMRLNNGENGWRDVGIDYHEVDRSAEEKREISDPFDDDFQYRVEAIVEKHANGLSAGYDDKGNYVSPNVIDKIQNTRRDRRNGDRSRRQASSRTRYLFPNEEYDGEDYEEGEEEEDGEDEDEEEYNDSRVRRGNVDDGDIEDETINKEETPCAASRALSRVLLVVSSLVCLRVVR